MGAPGTRSGETGGGQKRTRVYKGFVFKSPGISAQKDDEDFFLDELSFSIGSFDDPGKKK